MIEFIVGHLAETFVIATDIIVASSVIYFAYKKKVRLREEEKRIHEEKKKSLRTYTRVKIGEVVELLVQNDETNIAKCLISNEPKIVTELVISYDDVCSISQRPEKDWYESSVASVPISEEMYKIIYETCAIGESITISTIDKKRVFI